MSKYVHTNAGFGITCTFTGNEDASVTWSTSDGDLSTGEDDFVLAFEDKVATLTKSSPATTDDATYTCTFKFDTEADSSPSATQEIVVACKCLVTTSYLQFFKWWMNFYLVNFTYLQLFKCRTLLTTTESKVLRWL